jgi:hypothetical protein
VKAGFAPGKGTDGPTNGLTVFGGGADLCPLTPCRQGRFSLLPLVSLQCQSTLIDRPRRPDHKSRASRSRAWRRTFFLMVAARRCPRTSVGQSPALAHGSTPKRQPAAACLPRGLLTLPCCSATLPLLPLYPACLSRVAHAHACHPALAHALERPCSCPCPCLAPAPTAAPPRPPQPKEGHGQPRARNRNPETGGGPPLPSMPRADIFSKFRSWKIAPLDGTGPKILD